MSTYRIKDIDLLHNGKKHLEGSEIELSDKEAKPLRRYLENVPAKAPDKDPDGGSDAGAGKGETPPAGKKTTGGNRK